LLKPGCLVINRSSTKKGDQDLSKEDETRVERF